MDAVNISEYLASRLWIIEKKRLIGNNVQGSGHKKFHVEFQQVPVVAEINHGKSQDALRSSPDLKQEAPEVIPLHQTAWCVHCTVVSWRRASSPEGSQCPSGGPCERRR